MIKKLIKGILMVIFALLALIVFLPAVISVAFDMMIILICIGGLSLIAWLCRNKEKQRHENTNTQERK